MFKPLFVCLHKIVAIPSQVADLCQNLRLPRHAGQTQNLANHSQNPQSKKDRSQRVLIMSLGRAGGCSQYAFKLLEHFRFSYTLYQTKYAILEEWQECAIHITTYYHNRLSFVLNTLCILPWYFVKIIWQSRHYDVLFLPYFHFWNLAFILAFRLCGKRVVIVEHDGVVHIGEPYPFQQSLVSLCMKYANEIIFLTHFVKNRVPQSLTAHKKIHIIPHGLYDFEGLARTPKTYSKNPNILFFGRVTPYKGIDLLISALSRIPSHLYHSFIIAGKSSMDYDISSLDPAKVEIFDTFLSQDEIAQIFNQCHILVMPYIEASQSGVASIAIANCIPTIYTDVGGLKEQFSLDADGRQCALMCESNTESIANALRTLLSDETLYENLSQSLSLRSKELEWDTIAKKIQDILMLGGGGHL